MENIRKRRHASSIKRKNYQKKQRKSSQKFSKTFSDMPDEILLRIFRYLDLKHLLRYAQLSKRINPICHDKLLWQKVDLSESKTVPSGLLELVIKNGCKYLSLEMTKLEGSTFVLKNISQLRTLNLTFFEADPKVHEKLLASCHFLEKITLDGLVIRNNMINKICHQNGKTLQVRHQNSL